MRRFTWLAGAGLLVVASITAPLAAAPAKGGARSTSGTTAFDTNSIPVNVWRILSPGAKRAIERRLGVRADQKRPPSDDGGQSSATSPAPSPNDAATNVVVNNPLTDNAIDTQVSPSIATGVLAQKFVVFDDANSPAGQFTGISVSTDNGNTWVDKGNLPADANGEFGFGRAIFDQKRNTAGIVMIDGNLESLGIYRSTNLTAAGGGFGARTEALRFSPGVFTGGSSILNSFHVAVDNTPGNSESGYGNIYATVRYYSDILANDGGNIFFVRSTDGGNTWSQPDLNITARNEGSWITVGPDHSVYVFYFDYVNNAAAAQIRMRKSTDQGLTFGPAVTAANLKQAGASIFQFDTYLPVAHDSNAFPQCVVNPVNALQIFCTFNDLALEAGDRGDIYTTRSSDGGATWPQAASPFNFSGSFDADKDDFLPSIAIAANPTDAANPARLVVSYYTRRRDAGNSLTDRWARIANVTAAGTLSLPNPGFLVTPTNAPVTLNGDYSTTLWSYYEDMTADEDFIYVPWVQARQSPTVPARTRQNDILFARIKINEGFGPTIVYQSTTITGGNGNGLIDRDECNEFTVTVRNYGSIQATNVTGQLISGTPGVTVSFANSPYPSIGAFGFGDIQSNTLKFYVNTSAAIPCGTTINFTLRLTTDQGVFDIPFSIAMNPNNLVFNQNVPTPIPDAVGAVDGAATSTLAVAGLIGPVTKVNFSMQLSHTFDSDIVARLRAPDGVTLVWLVVARGGGGDNFGTSCANRTVFDQAAATDISTGAAPFVGTFRPEPGPRTIDTYTVPAGNSLNAFNGLSGAAVNGNWSLELFDRVGLDTGSVNCWSLTISTAGCPSNGGVGCTLTANCSATPDTGNAPLLVNFDVNPAGGGGSFTYAWDFGDGFSGNIKNPSHTYTNAGVYNATVTVKDILTPGQPTFVCSKTITVGQTFATPTITSASPNCGNVTGGTVVVINGTNFEPQATVSLAGVPATVTVDSSTQITATSANRVAAPAFTGNIVVSNGPGATATLTNGYTYAVRGDANNTGTLEAADIFAINARLTLGIPAVLPSLCNFDANTSGAIEASDMFFLNSVLLGLIGPPGP